MPAYRFTDAYPRLFPTLSHDDPGVSVTRADPDGAPTTGTVVLYPGDVLTTPDTLTHAYLVAVGGPPPAPHRAGEDGGGPEGPQTPPSDDDTGPAADA